MELVRALPKYSPSKAAVVRMEPVRDSEGLHALASRILSPVPLPEILEWVVEFLSIETSDSCFIYVLEEDALLLRASRCAHPDVVKGMKLKLGQGIAGWVASHKKPVCIAQNAYKDARFIFFNQFPQEPFESFLSVPIVSSGRILGVINLQGRAIHHYEPSEIQLVSTTGLLLGAAAGISLLEAKAAQLSQQLETRKLVERAKGILQRNLGISEQGAYTTLQRESCRRRKPMRDLAEAIIFNEDLKRDLKS
jgi:signal transduction protein with GAF and PtsI domain